MGTSKKWDERKIWKGTPESLIVHGRLTRLRRDSWSSTGRDVAPLEDGSDDGCPGESHVTIDQAVAIQNPSLKRKERTLTRQHPVRQAG
jgi:hypothetical protein